MARQVERVRVARESTYAGQESAACSPLARGKLIEAIPEQRHQAVEQTGRCTALVVIDGPASASASDVAARAAAAIAAAATCSTAACAAACFATCPSAPLGVARGTDDATGVVGRGRGVSPLDACEYAHTSSKRSGKCHRACGPKLLEGAQQLGGGCAT